MLVKLWPHFGPSDHLRQKLELVKYKLTVLVRLKHNTGFVNPYPHPSACNTKARLDMSTAQVAHSCDWPPKDAEKTFIGKHEHTVHRLLKHLPPENLTPTGNRTPTLRPSSP
jgi:hypothetical protein